jgi:arginase family enzyme
MAVLFNMRMPEGCREIGSLEVPPWLLPNPPASEQSKITSEEFVGFIDRDGCREMAESVKRFVAENVLPDVPCMVGIDHCLTGGAFEAVADFYGKDAVSLVVVDTHTDAVPMSALSDAIQYDMDVNPQSVYDPADPFLYGRPDSYNASSFLHHLLRDGLVRPKDLFVLGVSDYPDKKTFRIKDPRIRRYASAFSDLKRSGCTILTKKECLLIPKKLKAQLSKIRTPYVYVSVDMDIGAMNAVQGVRFRNWKGLEEEKIYKLVDAVAEIATGRASLAGMDVMEMDPRRAGEIFESGRDRTYEIAANIISRVALRETKSP